MAKVSNVYYAAFVAGNADQSRGEVFWAWSQDGATWHYGSPAIIAPLQISALECFPYAIGQVSLAFNDSDGFFYFLLTYTHPNQYSDMVLFRINYDPASPSGTRGLGNTWEVYHPGSATPWVTSVDPNRRLRVGVVAWTYDAPNDARAITPFSWDGGLGPGDMKFHTGLGQWLRVYFDIALGAVSWQSTASLSSPVWSSPSILVRNVCTSYGRCYNVAGDSYPGLLEAQIGTTNGWWLLIPVHNNESCGVFAGMGTVTAALTYLP